MSSLIHPRSETKYPSPKATKTRIKKGWKNLMRTIQSKLPLPKVGVLKLGLNKSRNLPRLPYSSSTSNTTTHHHQVQHQYYRCSYDQDDVGGDEDAHDVFYDASFQDDETTMGLDQVYQKISARHSDYGPSVVGITKTTTARTLQRGGSCEVDTEAERFINKFRKSLRDENLVERQKSGEEFLAMLARSVSNDTTSCCTTLEQKGPSEVDAKADEFIKEFRRRLSLENLNRQQSTEEFLQWWLHPEA